jgi:hypothetical protein
LLLHLEPQPHLLPIALDLQALHVPGDVGAVSGRSAERKHDQSR